MALAYTDTGGGTWTDYALCKSCHVYIHNDTTGANGSTNTDSGGAWIASGFIGGDHYTVTIAYFGIPGCDYTNSSSVGWWQTNAGETVGTASLAGAANESGCPLFPEG